ncbi:expressed unknown protein [Seminavis robusta]|uniref:Uncharacterized protein n=1 Tax=Seminavis robusta TaxID=568900 RepID=A0A9N8HNA9_9STRA|nr:expressed unknown protein [Seminavis robusta]|eukprot:Sro978_g227080.1 n/a (150) ;mRNA; f:2362-2811
MTSSILSPLLVFLLALLSAIANEIPPVPQVDQVARVKEHRRGANGDLVPGEENLRKLLLQWHAIPGALEYEVCHNCHISDSGDVLEGNINFVPTSKTKAGRPVFVFPNAPLGKNSFHVRVSVEAGVWGPWSEQRNFVVDEPGQVQHDEL